MANNEFSTEQFDHLEIAERNLNNNLDNDKVIKAFLETAMKVKKSLQDHYAEQWTDPAKADAETVQELSQPS